MTYSFNFDWLINNGINSREEIESWFKNYNLSDYLTPDEIEVIEKTNIWNKDNLARKIVDHYYFKESGFETSAMFKHYAKVAMQEIMERKLPLIYTASLKYDPLINVDYTETFNRQGSAQNKGNSNSNSSNSANGLSISSDTPQGQINKQDILNGTYASATNASETESKINDETNTSSSGTSNESYTKNVKGNSGVSATYQKMIEQFRDNVIAIDSDIIKELKDLFMGLF